MPDSVGGRRRKLLRYLSISPTIWKKKLTRHPAQAVELTIPALNFQRAISPLLLSNIPQESEPNMVCEHREILVLWV